MPIARRLLISRHVQGVSFRDWTVAAARELGLAGWVRNRDDGQVEAVIEGDGAAAGAMIARCRQGPRHARVDAVEASDVEPTGGTTFERR